MSKKRLFSQKPNCSHQRNLRPVVSVGVSTECVRLECEGPHGMHKYGCNPKLVKMWVCPIGDLKVFWSLEYGKESLYTKHL